MTLVYEVKWQQNNGRRTTSKFTDITEKNAFVKAQAERARTQGYDQPEESMRME